MEKQSKQLARFQALWRRLGGDRDVTGVFTEMSAYYESEGRHYHNLAHIEYCLSVFDAARACCHQPDLVEMALWFHDVIYVMGGTDNELKSAEHFMAASVEQIDDSNRQQIFDLIMATDHSGAPTEDDQRFIVEVDLSGFGLPWNRFQSDGRNVRSEMTHLTDDEFYPAQMRFMQSLADRQPLYTYPWFNQRYEAAARSNIARYTSELQQRGYQMKAAV